MARHRYEIELEAIEKRLDGFKRDTKPNKQVKGELLERATWLRQTIRSLKLFGILK